MVSALLFEIACDNRGTTSDACRDNPWVRGILVETLILMMIHDGHDTSSVVFLRELALQAVVIDESELGRGEWTRPLVRNVVNAQ